MSDQNPIPQQGNLFDQMTGSEPQSGEVLDAEQQEAGAFSLANFTTMLDFESEDMVIPRLRLAQGLTAEVQDGTASPGQWLLTGFESRPEVTAIPMLFARQRTLRDDAGAVLCRSRDARRGEGDPGGDCETCPMNQWADGPNGKRVPPKCTFSYAYIVYIVEFEAMALVEFRRTSLQAGKSLNTMVGQRGLGNFAVKLRSSKQVGNRGSYYQVVVSPTVVDNAVKETARQIFRGSAA